MKKIINILMLSYLLFIIGCDDDQAQNQSDPILGCSEEIACNYNENVTEDDGSCTYAEENYDCEGNCLVEVDCADNCGGSAVIDECDVCGGPGILEGECDCDGNVEDCNGLCGGEAVLDDQGECQTDNLCQLSFQGELSDFNEDLFTQDLATSVGGDVSQINILSISERGTLNIKFIFIEIEGFPSVDELLSAVQTVDTVGDYAVTVVVMNLSDPTLCASEIDCNNMCGGSAEEDECGICEGSGPIENYDCDGNCIALSGFDCAGECGGSAEIDECGICEGDGIADGTCDCDGNTIDCNGDCFGVESECCYNAEAILEEANTMLTNLSNQLHECDNGNDSACLGDDPDTFPFVEIYERYESILGYGDNCGVINDAHFGMGVLSMFTITQDQILIDILEAWQDWEDYEGYFEIDRNSNSKLRSGFPTDISDLAKLSNIKYSNYIPIKFIFNKLHEVMSDDRDHHGDAPNFSDFQTIASQVLIPKITNTINHFDNVLDEDFIFTITPEMQNDIDTDPVELDDAEIYVMKAFMHQLRSLLYGLSAYNLDFICAERDDIEECGLDLTNLDQNGDWLTINDGAENYLSNAHDDLNNLIESLQGAYNFLGDEGYHENGVFSWDDISEYNQDNDDNMDVVFQEALDLINETHVVEMCGEDEWVSEMVDFAEGTCYDKEVSLLNFMDNPVENWKAIFPPYEVEWVPDEDYDVDQEHEETTNYNFDDGCFDIDNMESSTAQISQTQNIYYYENYYFYPESQSDVDLEEYNIEQVMLTINLYNIQWHSSDPDWREIEVELGYFDPYNIATISANNFFSQDIAPCDEAISEEECSALNHCWWVASESECEENPNTSHTFTYDITEYINNDYGTSLYMTRVHVDPNWFMDGDDVNVKLDFTYQENYPRLEYYWYSEECWNNQYTDNGDYLGYGCGYQSENNTAYPDNYADGDLLCTDYDGGGTISCDCSDASTFANQVYTNMLENDNVDFTFIRLIYFPNGSWYKNEPHWDYDVFYLEQDMEPCLTWDADSFSEWQDGWTNWQLNGLFPDMNKNEFFDILGITSDHDWDKFSGGCDE